MTTHGPLQLPTGLHVAWQRALIATVAASGLTGRGGGAFPAAIKLAAAQTDGGGGVLVVNGMESDPTSDKDKVLMTRAPHLVLDGAQFVAAACGAQEIIVCIPAGRDGIAVAVSHAIAERLEMGQARTSEVLVRPPDRFVAGEESALVRWIGDGKALPKYQPAKGIPLRIGRVAALVHNAETLAHIALIARHGADPFRARGTEGEPGTYLVTIGGAVARPGVVEVEGGASIYDIARRAGPVDQPVAFLVGGYGGAWVAFAHGSLPFSSAALRPHGVSSGLGAIVALGPSACGVAETARIARYLARESAAQCGPCVFGLAAIAEDLAQLCQGRAGPDGWTRLSRRLETVDGRGACRHPDGAVSLVRSALHVFSSDFESHAQGVPCAYQFAPTQLRFPVLVGI
jgi:NADH:ubiquinone oxidoreductase subunit F (NADH-binding)